MRILETSKHLGSKESNNKIYAQQFYRLGKSFDHVIVTTITTGTESVSHPCKTCAQRQQKQDTGNEG